MSEDGFSFDYSSCTVCPRNCRADRRVSAGVCGMGDRLLAAKAMLHRGEEPCICDDGGCGAVFFSGCVLGCVFCQNEAISHGKVGKELTEERLCEILLEFQKNGAQCIDLVSPTQFAPTVFRVLKKIRPQLNIPVVWNTGGYEKPELIGQIASVTDIFLQDVKYFSSEVSRRYARASDYFTYALASCRRMVSEKGSPRFDEKGHLLSGVILRHLVLPGNRKDSVAVLRAVAREIGTENVVLSLMSQYTPPRFQMPYKELSRRVTSFEYDSVCEEAVRLGYRGYCQERSSATDSYIPDLDFGGL